MSDKSIFYYFVHWLIAAVALLVTSWIVPGFRVKGFASALWAAIIVGLANIIIWPILIILTLPINILTLGLFTFVVNAIVLRICAGLLDGFAITSWFSAFLGAIVLSLTNTFLHFVFF